MKKLFRFLCLTICLAAVCILFTSTATAAEWTIPEGKTEGELSYTPEMLNGTFMCGYRYDNRVTGVQGAYWTAYLYPKGQRNQDNGEKATRGQVTMLSGSEAQAKVFWLENTDDGIGLFWDSGAVLTGEATYRLELESENYWASTEFSVTFQDVRDIEIEKIQDTVTFLQRKKTDVNTVIDSSVLRLTPEMPFSLIIGTFDEYEGVTEKYSFSGCNFTGKLPGDYLMWLRVIVGLNNTEIRYPISIHVEEVPELTWDEKEEGQTGFRAETFSGTWMSNYAGDVRVSSDYEETGWALDLYPAGDKRDDEKREETIRAELTLVSGDENLKDAFTVMKDSIRANAKDRSLEGEATFRLDAESEHYKTSIEFTAQFADFTKLEITPPGEPVEVQADEEYSVNYSPFLGTVVKISPEIKPLRAHFPYGENRNDPNGGYEISGRNFIARKPGSYDMTVILEIGSNWVEVPVPVTFRAASAEEREAEWNDAWPPAGRKEARFAEGDGHWSGISFINGEHTGTYHHPVRISDDLSNWEDAQQCHVTFVSGDEHLRGFVKAENKPGERVGFYQDTGAVKEPGAAEFRIDAYSEHYYITRTISMTVADADQVTVELVSDTVNVPVGGEDPTYLNNLFTEKKFVRIIPEYRYSCSIFVNENEWQVENEDYTLNWSGFTAKKAGDYPMTLRVFVGDMGLDVDVPITVHAAEEISKAAVDGDAPVNDNPEPEWTTGEEEYRNTKRNTTTGTMTSQTGTTTGYTGPTEGQSAEFSGADQVTAECSNLEYQLRNVWFYVPSTLPEGMYGESTMIYLNLNPIGKYSPVIPSAYSVEMISGDEEMKDMLQISDLTYEGGSRSVYLNVNTHGITKPGEATYRIRLEEGKLYYEDEFEVRVLSWEDYPLFDIIEGGDTANVRLSAGNDNVYYSESIAAMFLTDHVDQIIAEHPELASDSNNAQLYVYENGQYTEDQLKQGYTYSGRVYQFLKAGSYDFTLHYSFGALNYSKAFTLNALPYRIQAKGIPAPGGTVQYSIRDEEPESGRSFTWMLSGEGVTLDPDTLILTIQENLPEGTAFTVTATPSDGGAPVTADGVVYSGALPMSAFTSTSSGVGFHVPILMTDGMDISARSQLINYSTDQDADHSLTILYSTQQMAMFTEEAEDAGGFYDSAVDGVRENGTAITEEKTVSIGGHPARLFLTTQTTESGDDQGSYGYLLYTRNNVLLIATVITKPQNGASMEEIPPVTMTDMERIAGLITYNPAEAPYSVDDVAITVTGGTTVTAGKKLQLKAEFANTEKVNKKAKNDEVVWTVADGQGGDTPEGIQIDKKGTLSAAKTVTEVTKVKVTAVSTVFGSTKTLEVTVIPAAESISVAPEELFFYIGEDKTETVQAQITPDTVPPIGITWVPKKAGIVEIVPDDENGTAQIRALQAGSTEVTVTEPGGKKARVKVTVADPVTAVELSTKGKTVPGGTVTVMAQLTPKKPGNPALEWVLDVGEEIATINEKGQVKISKTAQAGTVITVTCRALGAPEAIEQTIQIEVAEK